MAAPSDNPVSEAADPAQAALEALFSRIGDVSTLPTVAAEVLRIAEDENSSVADLVRVIQQDPALSAKLLRLVNSAHYSLRTRVADLKSAVSLLGFKEVRNLALTVYVARLFKAAGTYRNYHRLGLWNHLVAVASTSRLAAQHFHKPLADEAYLAGLLHDVGIILIDQYIHPRFCRILDQVDAETPTCDVEHQLLGFDHTQLGAFIGSKWQFHDAVVAAIGYHHNPDAYGGPHQDIVDLVALSNYLCSRRGLTSLGVQNVPPPPAAVYDRLRIARDALGTFWDRFEAELETVGLLAAV